MDNACAANGCRNWASDGTIFCLIHLHGEPAEMPPATAARKLALEKKRSQ